MTWMTDLPPAAVRAVKSETPGEIVKWAGIPNAGSAFVHGCAAWLMGIPWTALTGGIFIALLAAAFSGKPPPGGLTGFLVLFMIVMTIFVGAFVLLGLGMMAAPFWAYAKARRTVYAITDRRVIIVHYGRLTETKTLTLDRIVRWSRKERRDGSGSLRLVIGFEKDSDGDTSEVSEELFAVPNVREAERLIEAMRPRDAA